jgi:hypothetical protein
MLLREKMTHFYPSDHFLEVPVTDLSLIGIIAFAEAWLLSSVMEPVWPVE